MTDPKSMERLAARFESNQDKHNVLLLYCFWCDEHEPLSVDDLPPRYKAWKRQGPVFRVECEDGFHGLIIVASKDDLAKSRVLQTCGIAEQTFHEDLEKHGFEPDPSAAKPEANWLKALVSAALDDKLGFEGFENKGVVHFDGDRDAPTESTISSDDIEWCDKGLLPRGYLPMRDIAEASLILLDRLSTKTEASKVAAPKAKVKKKTDDEKAADYFERNQKRCWDPKNTVRLLASEAGIKHASGFTQSNTYKKEIGPRREQLKSVHERRRGAEKRMMAGNPFVDDSEAIQEIDKALDALMDQDYELRTDRE